MTADAPERDEVQEEHLAVTRAVAARIAGLTERQVDYWAGTGLIEPTVDTRLSPGRRIRLRSWSRSRPSPLRTSKPCDSAPPEVRFVCDHDVDAAVAATLRRLGHDAWTAANAGLSAVSDDELTVYAHDQSANLIEERIDELVAALSVRKDVWVRLSAEGLSLSSAWT